MCVCMKGENGERGVSSMKGTLLLVLRYHMRARNKRARRSSDDRVGEWEDGII